jgi:hypothetical protein
MHSSEQNARRMRGIQHKSTAGVQSGRILQVLVPTCDEPFIGRNTRFILFLREPNRDVTGNRVFNRLTSVAGSVAFPAPGFQVACDS